MNIYDTGLGGQTLTLRRIAKWLGITVLVLLSLPAVYVYGCLAVRFGPVQAAQMIAFIILGGGS
jgi:hypothetical protein